MANEHTRDRGKLFEETDKKKPSQPDFFGDCVIDGTAYELRGWRREEQLTISLAPPRGDRNTYPPDVFRGALDAAPPVKPSKPNKSGRGVKDESAPAVAAWSGDIVSEDAAYTIRAFEKQGKSGVYWTLEFERLADPPKKQPTFEPSESDLDD